MASIVVAPSNAPEHTSQPPAQIPTPPPPPAVLAQGLRDHRTPAGRHHLIGQGGTRGQERKKTVDFVRIVKVTYRVVHAAARRVRVRW